MNTTIRLTIAAAFLLIHTPAHAWDNPAYPSGGWENPAAVDIWSNPAAAPFSEQTQNQPKDDVKHPERIDAPSKTNSAAPASSNPRPSAPRPPLIDEEPDDEQLSPVLNLPGSDQAPGGSYRRYANQLLRLGFNHVGSCPGGEMFSLFAPGSVKSVASIAVGRSGETTPGASLFLPDTSGRPDLEVLITKEQSYPENGGRAITIGSAPTVSSCRKSLRAIPMDDGKMPHPFGITKFSRGFAVESILETHGFHRVSAQGITHAFLSSDEALSARVETCSRDDKIVSLTIKANGIVTPDAERILRKAYVFDEFSGSSPALLFASALMEGDECSADLCRSVSYTWAINRCDADPLTHLD